MKTVGNRKDTTINFYRQKVMMNIQAFQEG